MWIAIFAMTIILVVAGVIYLVNRIRKFQFIKKLSKENTKREISIATILLVLCIVILWITMGSINAIVCMIHLACFWLIFDLIFKLVGKKKQSKRYYAGALAIIFSISYLSVGYYLANHVWQTNYSISTDKMEGKLRIVQFADSHVGATFDGKGFKKYVDEMQQQNPDVVLITGDFVDDDTSKEDMLLACEALGTLKTTYGVYFAFGNHDKGYYDPSYRGYSGDDLIKALEENGVKVLQDENVLIDNRVYIIGRQDLSEEAEHKGKRATMKELVNDIDNNKFTVVMDHQPGDYENEREANVDLVLSGHTHGGQLIPLGLISDLLKINDKTYGYEKREDTNFIVTSGISDWAIKFKTGCKSEYTVIDIEGK